ncbi:MAG: hypothetical protein ACFB6R_13335 [Alphaproteobacteria bacterium]
MTSHNDVLETASLSDSAARQEMDIAARYAPSGVDRDTFVKARRGRNVAIAVSLIGFAVLLFAVTLVKLGPGAVARPF